MSARERLAERQAALLRAVLADGDRPAGFDPEQLRVERDVLRAKRGRLTAHLRPDLADELGDRFRELFDTYAATHPRQAGVGARQDADAFASWLSERGEPRRGGGFPRRFRRR